MKSVRMEAGSGPASAGFSLVELMIAMLVTMVLMAIVFTVMRQNQAVYAVEAGQTQMNENIRAAAELLTREIQGGGTGLRGFTAPVLGVDGAGDGGDHLAILYGDPYAPIAAVDENAPGADGVTSVAVSLPSGAVNNGGVLTYRDDKGREQPLYASDDLYILYREDRFLIVKVGGYRWLPSGQVMVDITPDQSNPKAKYGDYRYDAATDANGAQFARLDSIITYRFDVDEELLERRENHEPWAAVARGIKNFRVQYRVLTEEGALSEPFDAPPEERDAIRSVVVTLRARTPDIAPDDRRYRETAERIEITPRNMRLPPVAEAESGS